MHFEEYLPRRQQCKRFSLSTNRKQRNDTSKNTATAHEDCVGLEFLRVDRREGCVNGRTCMWFGCAQNLNKNVFDSSQNCEYYKNRNKRRRRIPRHNRGWTPDSICHKKFTTYCQRGVAIAKTRGRIRSGRSRSSIARGRV